MKSMNKYSMHKLDCLMKKWEYKNLSTTKVSKMDVSALNELGQDGWEMVAATLKSCLLYTSPSPRDGLLSRMPSSA